MSGCSVSVQAGDFDVGAEYAALVAAGGDAGAVAMFVGRVRGSGDVNGVQALVLEHYPGMTERSLQALAAEASARWPGIRSRIVHRHGHLPAGAQIVFVGVTGAHRADTQAACEFLMDALKTRAPFWKREQGAGGEGGWVAQKASDLARAARWDPEPPAGATGRD